MENYKNYFESENLKPEDVIGIHRAQSKQYLRWLLEEEELEKTESVYPTQFPRNLDIGKDSFSVSWYGHQLMSSRSFKNSRGGKLLSPNRIYLAITQYQFSVDFMMRLTTVNHLVNQQLIPSLKRADGKILVIVEGSLLGRECIFDEFGEALCRKGTRLSKEEAFDTGNDPFQSKATTVRSEDFLGGEFGSGAPF
jgi:hypothetical protein